MTGSGRIGVGLVGFGYWGPNLARNFTRLPQCELRTICDLDAERREVAGRDYPTCEVAANYQTLLDDPAINLVVVATPVLTHYELARRALEAGKDVLVEKPLTHRSETARQLIELAERQKRILAVDHTFLFTPAITKIKELVDAGEIGELFYVDSLRVNRGRHSGNVSVLWDLGPHDIAILCHLVDRDPLAVTAVGACYASNGVHDLAYLHLQFGGGLVAHCTLNWLAPVKLRRTLIGGSHKTIVYDDMEPSEKVKVYGRGELPPAPGSETSGYRLWTDCRPADGIVPKLALGEALAIEAEHLAEILVTRGEPISGGRLGLRVVRILEAAERSFARDGGKIALDTP